MPLYRSPAYPTFRPLKSVERQTVFLRGISDEQFEQFQEHAKTASDPGIHDQAFKDISRASRLQLIHGLWGEHHARHRGEPTGGGLGSAFNWLGKKLWSPFKGAWNIARNTIDYYTQDNTISGHTRIVASCIQQTYNKNIDERKDRIGNFHRIPSLSSDWLDVWKDDDRDQMVVTVRGSRDAEDFAVDDVGILSGAGPRDLVSTELREIFKEYGDKYAIECAGHSLGASLLATSLSKNPDMEPTRIDYFNPGTTPIPLIDDAVKDYASDDRAYYYMNAVDPVAWGAWVEHPVHTVFNKPQGKNPMDNHSVEQWIMPQNVPGS